MTDQATALTLRILLASGRVHEFAVTDPAAARSLIGGIDPEHIFEREVIVVAGHHEEAGFRSREIRRLEVVADELPEWRFGPMIERAEVIDSDELEQLRQSLADLDREQLRLRNDEDFDGLMELEDTVGERTSLRFHGQSIAPALRAGVLGRLLDAKCLYARRGSTAYLFNPRHIASARLFPGLPDLPPDAFQAERQGH